METSKTAISPGQTDNLEQIIFQKPPVYQDAVFRTGLIFIGLSALAFFLSGLSFWEKESESFFGIFVFNYGLSACYFFVLLFTGRLRFRWKDEFKNYAETISLFLVLGLISAYSLNRLLPIFEDSAIWLAVFLVILGCSVVLLCFRRQLPKLITIGLYFILGSGLVLYAYLSVYLLPYYHLGLFGAILLGFSLHVFIPLFSFLFLGVQFYREGRQNRAVKIAGLAGITLPLVVLALFLWGWQNAQNQIRYAQNKSIAEEEPLPTWVAVSRELAKTPLAEKLIKTDLVYSTPRSSGWWRFDMPGGMFDETRKHDPLVMISSLLFGNPALSTEDRIKILETMYDSRHKTLERLWTGEQLQTSSVISAVRIYPEYRLAYTEKTLTIKNNNAGNWSRQEAIYTFHLPEGGVVTSLSLWINGREEKGILTTKAQADSAYKTIVGVESRDPSVVHWQEGNTVSVRVFPCTPTEERRFKIGVTAPLKKVGNQMVYQNIYFDGPTAAKAPENIKVDFTNQPKNLELPFGFSKPGTAQYESNSHFRNYWEIAFQAPPLSAGKFAFDGRQYQVQEYQKQYSAFEPKAVYLDLNAAWEKEELLDVWEAVKDRPVYAYAGKMVRLSDENLLTIFKQLKTQNFSLFPFHLVSNPESVLVISKSNAVSPNLKDLQNSRFAEDLKNAMQKPQKIRLYNVGEELSPYLKTLQEFRAFVYDQGSTEELTTLLQQKKFVTNPENEHTVVIHNANLQLTETAGMVSGTAPDHLLRLFTYNHLLQQTGSNYFNPNFRSDKLIAEAQKAYVISPFSSLIVLETQKDYDRFNIKDSQNASLHNASLHGSGSVPEPHEWFLILMVATVAIYLYFRPNMIPKIR